MPKVIFGDQEINCNVGDNLRKVLLGHNAELYNSNAKIINCMGIGSCGTCAVEIVGDLPERNWKEKTRLSLPPHNPAKGRRLACQVEILGDLKVTKYDGFWGQGDRPITT